MKRRWISCIFLLVLGLFGSSASARNADWELFRNHYPSVQGTRIDTCQVCHFATSFGRNPYGAAYQSNGRSDAALSAIENMDSDGDTYTNIAEIQALSYPGDASDVPPSGTNTPTNTIAPTNTPTNTLPPTNTPTNTVPTSTPTDTVVVPTNTPTNTVPTSTPTNTVPTATPTNTLPGDTATNTPTSTMAPDTATNSPTNTMVVNTATNTPTNTMPADTPTNSPTSTATEMGQVTATPTEVLMTSHAGRFATYEGSKTCKLCHMQSVTEVHGSVHYQWQGDTPFVQNMSRGGKLGGINDFCTYPDISWIGILTTLDGRQVPGGCSTCHVGMGGLPREELTADQIDNIDCLMCHSETYKRKVVRVDDQFRFAPDPDKITVPLLESVTDITIPDNDTCVNCHSYAGGGCNNKRGDLEETHRMDPPRDFDFHMASLADGGAGLVCTDCHTTIAHRFAGRGVDLRPTDLNIDVRCTNCHEQNPHHEYKLDIHTSRVDCTVCHIPFFAKIGATDMFRDYSQPAEFDEAKQLYDPHIEREAMVIPEYRFWNGTSYIYQFKQPAALSGSGRVTMAEPLGDITDPNAKLFPMKLHRGMMPIDPETDYLIPVKIGLLLQTGNVPRAIEVGAAESGMDITDTGYDFIPTERYMGIFHETSPKEDALQCDDCHYGGTRMDFGQLGYTLKLTRQSRPLCASCHEDESDEWNASVLFDKVHEKHVKDKKISCAECHNLTTIVTTPTSTPTNTVSPTRTPTSTPTGPLLPTHTPTSTPTFTPTVPTPTNSPTRTPSWTPSDTPTITPTATDTPTITPTLTPSQTPTGTIMPTDTPTQTPTATTTVTSVPTFNCDDADLNHDGVIDYEDLCLLLCCWQNFCDDDTMMNH